MTDRQKTSSYFDFNNFGSLRMALQVSVSKLEIKETHKTLGEKHRIQIPTRQNKNSLTHEWRFEFPDPQSPLADHTS